MLINKAVFYGTKLHNLYCFFQNNRWFLSCLKEACCYESLILCFSSNCDILLYVFTCHTVFNFHNVNIYSVGHCVFPCDLPVESDFIVYLVWLWSNMTEKNGVQIFRSLGPFPGRVFKVIQGHWVSCTFKRPYNCHFLTYDRLWPLKLRRTFCWTCLDTTWWSMSFIVEVIKQ